MKIYWDSQNHNILKNIQGSPVPRIEWALRDLQTVQLYFLEPQDNLTNPFVQANITVGTAIRFGLKAEGSFAATTFLAYQASWSKSGAGTTAVYTASIQLNTEELIAVVGETETDLIGEFTLESTDTGEDEETTQFPVRIFPDVIRGTEAGPVSVATLLIPFTDPDDSIKKVRLVNQDGETCYVFTPMGS